jgi:uracil-DNA glycosylase
MSSTANAELRNDLQFDPNCCTTGFLKNNLDAPRLFRDPAQIAHRRSELGEPHIKPLTEFAQSLRDRGYGHVPDFDPWDGGISAQILFLFEKPGPKAFASGFISRNNDDRSAEYTFNFMRQAGIPRGKTCLWNTVPGWNGTRKLTGVELQQGGAALSELIPLLPNLKVVVLVGQRAANCWSKFGNPAGLPSIVSAHPSPVNFAYARQTWNTIPSCWAKTKRFLG